MSTYQEISPIANKILKKYSLCDHCLGRLFSKPLNLSSNKLLGKKLKKDFNNSERCYICKNLFENLNHFLKLMLDVSSKYSFKTILLTFSLFNCVNTYFVKQLGQTDVISF